MHGFLTFANSTERALYIVLYISGQDPPWNTRNLISPRTYLYIYYQALYIYITIARLKIFMIRVTDIGLVCPLQGHRVHELTWVMAWVISIWVMGISTSLYMCTHTQDTKVADRIWKYLAYKCIPKGSFPPSGHSRNSIEPVHRPKQSRRGDDR